MSKICLCLCEKTLEENLRVLEQHRAYIDLVELRVDKLLPNERFLIRRFPALAGMPVVLTIRRQSDGGSYNGTESGRLTLIGNALAYAEADRRMNFAYFDIEEDVDVPSLEEAARAFGTRVIRSLHLSSPPESAAAITARVKALVHFGDEIVKYAAPVNTLDDVIMIYAAARELNGLDKILIAMGSAGVSTRILTSKIGSMWTYAYAPETGAGIPPAPGQLDPRTLCDTYRFRKIKPDSAVYGILGYPLKVTASPLLFNTVFTREKMNAIYVPFPSESDESFIRLAQMLDVRGASVTVPHKQNILKYLTSQSADVQNLGACNTIVRTEEGWAGYNTDTLGFSGSLLNFIGKKSFRGMKITIIGAGGAARAALYQIWRLGGKAFIINRSRGRAEELADKYGFAAGSLNEIPLNKIRNYSDIIINTTSVGMGAGCKDDPLPAYKFRGTEIVMDLVYVPTQSAFLARAAAAGCPTLNGYDMLLRQAKLQYNLFFNSDYPEI
ncbi:MAG: type I 3-dehydroquinate dehydratase [Spirochaetaceae bacterium]|jgi:3-dehydroquinate dehydratase/shikimate dehydrogenase|nr:type I 3-dehydroquinate dehydratase [Spirochaetaceae bacterium]